MLQSMYTAHACVSGMPLPRVAKGLDQSYLSNQNKCRKLVFPGLGFKASGSLVGRDCCSLVTVHFSGWRLLVQSCVIAINMHIMHIHTYIRMYTHIHIYTYIIYMHIHVCAYMHVYVLYVFYKINIHIIIIKHFIIKSF